MEKESYSIDTQDENNINNKKLIVVCPICRNRKSIMIPKSVVDNPRVMTCITIAPKIVCEHVFQLYLDKNFKIRGYSKSDYEVGLLEVSDNKFQEIKKNTIIKLKEETSHEGIPNDYWAVISKINGIRSVEEIIESSGEDSKTVLKTLIDLRSKHLISFDYLLDDYDIPVITEEGLSFLLNPKAIDNISSNNENLYLKIKSDLEQNKFEIIKSIDSKSSIKTLAKKCSINLQMMKDILKFLYLNGYIEFLSKELKLCLIFENIYKLFVKSIDKFLGKKGVAIFNKVLEKDKNPLIKLIKFTEKKNFYSFKAVRINIERQNESNITDLETLFLSPILNTFNKVKPALSLLSSNYMDESVELCS